MREKKLEYKWEKDTDRAVLRSGLTSPDAVERNWKIYFDYFFEYYAEKINKKKPKPVTLDVGCGSGVISKEFVRMGLDAYGVDFSKEVIKLAERYAPIVHFQRSSIYKLPFSDGFFDVVICLGVLQTVADPLKAIDEMFRVLKQDGIIIIRTLNVVSLSSFRGRKNPFFTFYNPLKLKAILKNKGFKDISIKGIYLCPKSLDFFSRVILWTKLYKVFNIFFYPIFCFLSHSFYISGIKKNVSSKPEN